MTKIIIINDATLEILEKYYTIGKIKFKILTKYKEIVHSEIRPNIYEKYWVIK